MKLGLLVLLFVACLPAVQASCMLDVADPVGDASPPGLPPYYDLNSLRVDWAADTLNWSWNATGMSDAINVLYWGGFVVSPIDNATGEPHQGTGGIKFHPGCDRYLDPEGIPTTECRLVKTSGTREGGFTLGELVSYLNWSEQGDYLTAHIPAGTIGLLSGTGLAEAYASVAVAVTVDARVAGPSASPHYTDRMDDLWSWPMCWNATGASNETPEDPDVVKPGEAPGPNAILLGLVLVLTAFGSRRR